MKIVMITGLGNGMMLKYSLPLMSSGHEVHLLTNKIGIGLEAMSSVTLYQTMGQLYGAIESLSDADIFHVHNEPSYPVTAVKEVWGDKKPVILNLNDTNLTRLHPDSNDSRRMHVDERNNFELADGVVYINGTTQEIVEKTYAMTEHTLVMPLYIPERYFGLDFGELKGGLVYGGRVSIANEDTPERDFFQHQNYLDLAVEANNNGIPFHVFSPRKKKQVRDLYKTVCYMHNPLPVQQYIRAMGSYDWGLVGNLTETEFWKYATTNKFFEYIAACVPIVSFNTGVCADIINKYGIGICVDSMAELKARWGEHTECRNKLIKVRRNFALEKHLHKLINLYEEVGA